MNASVMEMPSVGKQLDRLQQISRLMQFQARMPVNPFMTRDQAYKSVGCDPWASPYIYNNI